MCPNCRAFITTDDRVCPYCDAKVGPRRRSGQSGEILGGLIPQARFTTVMILLINFALYVADFEPQPVNAAGACPVMAMRNELYRLVTAGFLHGGILHILMNSWVLFDLGAEVEQFYDTQPDDRLLLRLHGHGLSGQFDAGPLCVAGLFGGYLRTDRSHAGVRLYG